MMVTPCVLHLAQDAVEVADAFGVEPRGRLVQEQQLRVAEQGLRETEALAHALGVALDAPVGGGGQADALEQRAALRRDRRP